MVKISGDFIVPGLEQFGKASELEVTSSGVLGVISFSSGLCYPEGKEDVIAVFNYLDRNWKSLSWVEAGKTLNHQQIEDLLERILTTYKLGVVW